MRKYKMPKILYAMLITILLILAVDYTYAYFSANTTASGKLGMADISARWMQSYYEGENIVPTYSDLNVDAQGFVDISGSELKRSMFTNIVHVNNDITLVLATSIDTPVYCRLKLEASYEKNVSDGQQTTKQTVDCTSYIKLAMNEEFLEDTAHWTLENGYYYYKTNGVLKKISSGITFNVANQLYLDPSSNSEIYGQELTIKLKAELVQADYVTVGTDVWTEYGA